MNVQIGNEKIGEIREFCYLGSKIRRDGRCNANICFGIGQAEKAYRCEAWTIGKGERRKKKIRGF